HLSRERRPPDGSYLNAAAGLSPTIAGSEPVGNGSAFGISGGHAARAGASGNPVLMSRRNPSSVSTVAAILAIWAKSVVLAPVSLLAVSKVARSPALLIN